MGLAALAFSLTQRAALPHPPPGRPPSPAMSLPLTPVARTSAKHPARTLSPRLRTMLSYRGEACRDRARTRTQDYTTLATRFLHSSPQPHPISPAPPSYPPARPLLAFAPLRPGLYHLMSQLQ